MRLLLLCVVVSIVIPQLVLAVQAAEAGGGDDAVARANSDFAFDLYAHLAKENPGKNIFFSPYSISSALAMVAEGARGPTALEMGRTLHFPDAARNSGDNAAALPWNMTPIHRGLAELNDHFNGLGREPTPELRRRIEIMRRQLDEANAQVAQLQHAGMFDRAMSLHAKAQEVADGLNALLPKVDQYELRIANALWGEKTYPFRADYVETMRKYYRTGGIFPMDFRNDFNESIQRINIWVEEQTSHRIKNLIDPDSFTEQQRKLLSLVLTNAVYFRGEWSEIFPADQTREEPFTLADGKQVKVPLMHHAAMKSAHYAAFDADGSFFATPHEIPIEPAAKQPACYPDDAGFELLELPYKGDALSMVILLPRSASGLPALEKLLSTSRLQEWMSKAEKRKVHVFLPRYRVDTRYLMSQTLQEMGMVRAFNPPGTPDGADFQGMCASDDPKLQLWISQVIHQAFVEVNEKGTEAAAATAVTMMAASAMPRTQPFTPTFRADRPFVFLIRDIASGSILFAGRLNDPRP